MERLGYQTLTSVYNNIVRRSVHKTHFTQWSNLILPLSSRTYISKQTAVTSPIKFQNVGHSSLSRTLFNPDSYNKMQSIITNTRYNKKEGGLNLPLFDIECPTVVQMPRLDLELPSTFISNEKQAARLIVIRRRKMKKHKLKKLRKRMKFEWAKVRQKRELRKEKLFQAKLVSQIKEAEKFSPEEYVSQKLKKAYEPDKVY